MNEREVPLNDSEGNQIGKSIVSVEGDVWTFDSTITDGTQNLENETIAVSVDETPIHQYDSVLKIIRESSVNCSEANENVRKFQESFRAEHTEDLKKRIIRNRNPYQLDDDDYIRSVTESYLHPIAEAMSDERVAKIVPVFVEEDGERRQSGHAVVEIKNDGIRPQYAVSIVLDVQSAGMLDSFDINFNVKSDDPRTVTHVIARKKS